MMELFLRLASVFMKVGLLTIGGGLAMIPILQAEMEAQGWLSANEFLTILGIAEMTPGPISVNTATFVGYRILQSAHSNNMFAAIGGALVATLSVCLPSLLCINTLGTFWQKHKNHPCMIAVFTILRPLVTGLVAVASISLVYACLKPDPCIQTSWQSPVLILVAFWFTARTKFSPVWILLGGMVSGLFLFS